jgi:hypothetical protein
MGFDAAGNFGRSPEYGFGTTYSSLLSTFFINAPFGSFARKAVASSGLSFVAGEKAKGGDWNGMDIFATYTSSKASAWA